VENLIKAIKEDCVEEIIKNLEIYGSIESTKRILKNKLSRGVVVKKHQYILEYNGLFTTIILPEDEIKLLYAGSYIAEIRYKETRYDIKAGYNFRYNDINVEVSVFYTIEKEKSIQKD
jgi:hypothetical protein